MVINGQPLPVVRASMGMLDAADLLLGLPVVTVPAAYRQR